ncbi:unnamed protein product [Parajaminaea phylloscopi]
MNDVVATGFAILILYLVVRFAFGGPSSQPQQHGPGHTPPSPGTHGATTTTQGSKTPSTSASRQTLISRFGLENRIKQQDGLSPPASDLAGGLGGDNGGGGASPITAAAKGKGRMTDDEWKAGSDRRREDLRRRKEEMILQARRRLLEKQQAQ